MTKRPTEIEVFAAFDVAYRDISAALDDARSSWGRAGVSGDALRISSVEARRAVLDDILNAVVIAQKTNTRRPDLQMAALAQQTSRLRELQNA
jgi:hypothetical protein